MLRSFTLHRVSLTAHPVFVIVISTSLEVTKGELEVTPFSRRFSILMFKNANFFVFSSFNRNFKLSLQQKQINEVVMEVIIDSKLYQQALTYAQQQGLNLTSVIENFLVRFVGSSKNTTEQAVPDVVLSLLGAGESVPDEDLNAREAYYDYLEQKYK